MRALMIAACLVLFAASAAIVGTYAYTIGIAVPSASAHARELWGYAFAIGAVALMILESASATHAAAAARAGDRAGATIHTCALALTFSVVMSLDLGFVSTAFEAGGYTDARADLLMRIFGGKSAMWADVLTVATALAFSLGRIAAAYYLFTPHHVEPIQLDNPKNAHAVITAAIRAGTFSQRGISRDHGLSPRVIRATLDDLQSRGIITAVPSARGTRVQLIAGQ